MWIQNYTWYAFLNRCVLSLLLKTSRDLADLTSFGNLFHNLGAEAEKERLPYVSVLK